MPLHYSWFVEGASGPGALQGHEDVFGSALCEEILSRFPTCGASRVSTRRIPSSPLSARGPLDRNWWVVLFLAPWLGRRVARGHSLAATIVDGVVQPGVTCERQGRVGSPDRAPVLAGFALGHALHGGLAAGPES